MSLIYQHIDGIWYNVELMPSELMNILQSGQLYDRHKNVIKVRKSLYHKDNFGNLLHVYAFSEKKNKYFWIKIKEKIDRNSKKDIEPDFI